MSTKDDKLASLLVHLAADWIAREAGRQTLITPTRADVKDRKNVIVYVSVFPESDRHHALQFLSRNHDEFKAFLKKEARFSVLPHVRFEFDEGEANRQRLDELSREEESR